jgi:TRAP-type C4-dicarboxylate transport system permease small subunit
MPRKLLYAILALLTVPAYAHVGNKDVFEQVTAGPYKLYVTIRTPLVIPGVATIEVRSLGAPVDGLTMTPLLLTGEASKHPPTADTMQRSAADPQFFTGTLWLMGTGSWQVRLTASGASGTQTVAIPVMAAATRMMTMQKPLGILLGILGVVLVLGVVGIVYGAVRESRLLPGLTPDPGRRRRSLLAAALALVFACTAVWLGGKWWNVEARDYAGSMHRNSELRLTLDGNQLTLLLGDPDPEADNGWRVVKNSGLMLDHGHLMHLYAIREPQMDEVFHLHPMPTGDKGLAMTLPEMPAGTYKLYADVVFRGGWPETETATLNIPAGFSNAPLGVEDATAAPAPLSAGDLGPVYKLPDGYTMQWDKPANLNTQTSYDFHFTLLGPDGQPATNMQPYLGMAGHAAFVKTDGTAFAHTHPEGSAAMPSMMLASESTADATGDNAESNSMTAPITSTVDVPSGFPSVGRYRVIVQMKHAATVETGVFDGEVK